MTSLSTRFFGQPSESRYREGFSESAVFCIQGPEKGTPYNRLRAGIQPARNLAESVAEVLEPQIGLQLVLLSARQLDGGLEIVAALARHPHRVALDRRLDLE